MYKRYACTKDLLRYFKFYKILSVSKQLKYVKVDNLGKIPRVIHVCDHRLL